MPTETAPRVASTRTTRRTVFSNRDECAHRWAANDQSEGRAGNVYFRDGVIYSYGSHFPMARHVKRGSSRFVLITTRGYSSSTAGHLCSVRRATRGQTVYYVDNVLADSATEHAANFRTMRREVEDLAGKVARSRTNAELNANRLLGRIREANAYREAVGLKLAPIVEPTPAELADYCKGAKDRLAKLSAKERAELAAEERRRAAELAASVAEWEQKLNAWRDGGEYPGSCPDRSHPLAQLAFIRVRGSRLETSLRAVVPLAAVLPILEMIRKGEAYTITECNGLAPGGMNVDGFALREVDQTARRVVIGCHTVTFEEIERAAGKAGL